MNTNFLVYEAKSFYNAYITLEQLTRSSEEAELLYCVPALVNGAFSIELTLKAILAKEQIVYNREHNLFLLFQLLPESFRCELLDHLVEKAPEYSNPNKLYDELVLISNAFIDWRYAFEDKPAPAINSRFLSAFANAAIWTMFSHYNVDLTPSSAAISDEEVEKKFQRNRAICRERNLKAIRSKKSLTQ